MREGPRWSVVRQHRQDRALSQLATRRATPASQGPARVLADARRSQRTAARSRASTTAASSRLRDRYVREPSQPVRARRKRDRSPSKPGFASDRVRYDESTVAQQRLDASPLAPRGHPRSRVSPRLAARRLPPPRLLQHRPAAVDTLPRTLAFRGDRRLPPMPAPHDPLSGAVVVVRAAR